MTKENAVDMLAKYMESRMTRQVKMTIKAMTNKNREIFKKALRATATGGIDKLIADGMTLEEAYNFSIAAYSRAEFKLSRKGDVSN